jgi:hypothetical protein
MIGLSRLITAPALPPRRDRISVRSLSRIRRWAALLGLISNLPRYRRGVERPFNGGELDRATQRALTEYDDPEHPRAEHDVRKRATLERDASGALASSTAGATAALARMPASALSLRIKSRIDTALAKPVDAEAKIHAAELATDEKLPRQPHRRRSAAHQERPLPIRQPPKQASSRMPVPTSNQGAESKRWLVPLLARSATDAGAPFLLKPRC